MEVPKKQVGKDSLKLQYLLPNDSLKVLVELKLIQNCSNLGLLLTRYLPFEAIDNTAYQRLDRRGNAKDDGTWKGEWLAQTAKQINDYKDLERLLTASFTRWKVTTSSAERFEARSLGRVLVGLGGESVLETSLTLQFITGLPIIPGSALKGLCRHYALFTIAAELGIKPLSAAELSEYKEKKESTPLQELDKALTAVEWSSELIEELEKKKQIEVAEQFRAIFGSTDYGGACIFYDAVVSALPQSGTLFEVDVMTPHFVKYYNSANAGKQIEPPSDNDLPTPINFLTVAAGTEFAFAVGVRRGFDKSLAEQAATWLKTALYEMGIGAKTAAGYGVFEKVK
jgi:CRISPR-associated protein Cmr6